MKNNRSILEEINRINSIINNEKTIILESVIPDITTDILKYIKKLVYDYNLPNEMKQNIIDITAPRIGKRNWLGKEIGEKFTSQEINKLQNISKVLISKNPKILDDIATTIRSYIQTGANARAKTAIKGEILGEYEKIIDADNFKILSLEIGGDAISLTMNDVLYTINNDIKLFPITLQKKFLFWYKNPGVIENVVQDVNSISLGKNINEIHQILLTKFSEIETILTSAVEKNKMSKNDAGFVSNYLKKILLGFTNPIGRVINVSIQVLMYLGLAILVHHFLKKYFEDDSSQSLSSTPENNSSTTSPTNIPTVTSSGINNGTGAAIDLGWNNTNNTEK